MAFLAGRLARRGAGEVTTRPLRLQALQLLTEGSEFCCWSGRSISSGSPFHDTAALHASGLSQRVVRKTMVQHATGSYPSHSGTQASNFSPRSPFSCSRRPPDVSSSSGFTGQTSPSQASASECHVSIVQTFLGARPFATADGPASTVPQSQSYKASKDAQAVFLPGRFRDVQLPVKSYDGEDCGVVTLPGSVFDVPLRKDIIHSTVRWQLAKRRAGTHSTKGVGEVNGTTRKPWRQKGTGRARHGSLRGPQFRGGATMHGPKPRSHEISIGKKVRSLALRIALSAKAAEGKLRVYQDLDPPSHKTKEMARHLAQAFPDSKKFLLVDQLAGKEVKEEGSSPLAVAEARSATGGVQEAPQEAPAGKLGESNGDSEADGMEPRGDNGSSGQEAAAKAGVGSIVDPFRPLSLVERRKLKELKKKEQLPFQKVSGKLLQATGNLHYVNVLPTLGLNVYSILQHDTLLMSKAALGTTIRRLQPAFPSRREKKILQAQKLNRQKKGIPAGLRAA